MRQFIKILALVFVLGMVGACVPKSSGSAAPNEGEGSTINEAYKETNFYYENFDDILIPKELDYRELESVTFDNPKFRAAILKFEGRVELSDLINFFVNNMAKDNWEQRTFAKGQVSVITFEKFNKSCMIQVQSGYKLEVTIIVVELKDAGSSEKNLAN